MISRCETPPPLPGTAAGVKIETLLRCYGLGPGNCELWQNCGGGVLCRFDARVLLCGRWDADELSAFLPFLGARSAEGGADELPALPGWRETVLPVLAHGGAPPEPKRLPEPDKNPPGRLVYEILSAADAAFPAGAPYLPWLSDLTRRRNLGLARFWTLSGAAAAGVIAQGSGLALIAGVAVLPERRGEGLASRLVGLLARDAADRGFTPVAIAGADSLVPFYRRLGFRETGRQRFLTPG